MVKIIFGAKGSGKTKTIISDANDAARNAAGNVVFITDTNRYIYDIDRKVRFLNAAEFDISTELGLLGFIRGLIAGDSDIAEVYVDGAHRLAQKDVADMQGFYSRLSEISEKLGTKFVLTVSTDNPPEYMREFIR